MNKCIGFVLRTNLSFFIKKEQFKDKKKFVRHTFSIKLIKTLSKFRKNYFAIQNLARIKFLFSVKNNFKERSLINNYLRKSKIFDQKN